MLAPSRLFAWPSTTARLLRATTRAVRQPYQHLQVRMVEGHQCQRVGHAHRKALLGHKFQAHSPNSRFTAGAAAINNQPLARIEVHGKQLFYFFGEDVATQTVVQIHFGMSGHFSVMQQDKARDEKETTRLVLRNDARQLLAHLSAMTVEFGGPEFYHECIAKLGPDPLREDADPELLWAKMQKSKKPVGLVLMDQSFVAGLGNIYRAEVLFKAGLHPEQPSNMIDRPTFDRLWGHCVTLLQRGFQTGSILTVDPEEARRLGPPWTRRYIYNHPTCGRCKSPVSTWMMAARKVYACETCQPLLEGTVLPAARVTAMNASKPHEEFASHCAPEPPKGPAQQTVAQLREQLASMGLETPKGARKPALVAQLEAALAAQPEKEASPETSPLQAAVLVQPASHGKPEAGFQEQKPDWGSMKLAELKQHASTKGLATSGRKADLVARLAAAAPAGGEVEAEVQVVSPAGGEASTSQAPKPGTAHLDDVASAQVAAAEKVQAGEGRNVEHVAQTAEDATGSGEVPAAAGSLTPRVRKAPELPRAPAETAAPAKKLRRGRSRKAHA